MSNNISTFAATEKLGPEIEKKLFTDMNFKKLYEWYRDSQIDNDFPEIKNFKKTVYSILAQFIVYDPEYDEEFLGCPRDFSFQTLLTTEKNEKLLLLALICYAIKFRSFYYIYKGNVSHGEMFRLEELRSFLEINSEEIIQNDSEISNMLSKTLVLIYDKMLSSKISYTVVGESKPTSATTFGYGSFAITDIHYSKDIHSGHYGSLNVVASENDAYLYTESRKIWHGRITDRGFAGVQNVFLYGKIDIDELNGKLAQYRICLPDYSTKYYGRQASNLFIALKDKNMGFSTFGAITMPFLSVIKFLRKGTDAKETAVKGSLIRFFTENIKMLLLSIAISFVVSLISMNLGLLAFLVLYIGLVINPWYNQKQENGKRQVFSLFK